MAHDDTKDLTEILCKRPADCSNEELIVFEKLVKEGGEVSQEGLHELIRQAAQLVFLYNDGQLAGIAALKHPKGSYKKGVFTKAKSEETHQDFIFEAGYIVVKEKFRGRRYSRQLLETLLGLAGNNPIYATTREDNEPMRKTNLRCGFKVTGSPYTSIRGDYRVVLYTRRGVI